MVVQSVVVYYVFRLTDIVLHLTCTFSFAAQLWVTAMILVLRRNKKIGLPTALIDLQNDVYLLFFRLPTA